MEDHLSTLVTLKSLPEKREIATKSLEIINYTDGCYGYRPELMIINEHGKYYSKDMPEHVYVYLKSSHGETSAG